VVKGEHVAHVEKCGLKQKGKKKISRELILVIKDGV